MASPKDEKFAVGDIITPTTNNPWLQGSSAPYFTFGKDYKVIRTSESFIYLIRDDGTEDGFARAYPREPYFRLTRASGEFAEDEIQQALEFIQS